VFLEISHLDGELCFELLNLLVFVDKYFYETRISLSRLVLSFDRSLGRCSVFRTASNVYVLFVEQGRAATYIRDLRLDKINF
jgi:hypothetical protein